MNASKPCEKMLVTPEKICNYLERRRPFLFSFDSTKGELQFCRKKKKKKEKEKIQKREKERERERREKGREEKKYTSSFQLREKISIVGKISREARVSLPRGRGK